ncbi:GNAT family N-acetyltransferase [Nocardioides sp. Bht2]|uniref:GNAT family N-acetyltransferase n=1 Tax=Nocardioides sp. Bht2 TaxID=3392297 RepID=UPI0039B42EC6
MQPEENRFESDPDELLTDDTALPVGWTVEPPDPDDPAQVERLTALWRGHQVTGRGWASATAGDVRIEIGRRGQRVRENVVIRDEAGRIVAWGMVHDRSIARMVFRPVIDRDADARLARTCSAVLVAWAQAQAVEVGTARGLKSQQIDTEAFADDELFQRLLARNGFTWVRTWWQMSRPVTADEAELVPDPADWSANGVRFRLLGRDDSGVPDPVDVHRVHDVLEEAFADHFNSTEETFDEFVFRLREDPGHRWDHWWLAELDDGTPAGALVGSRLPGDPPGSYVEYIGVLANARGRGVAKGLLHTVIADAARRGRDRVGLEVDADSPTGADGLYTSMGWQTRYCTESWHQEIAIAPQ